MASGHPETRTIGWEPSLVRGQAQAVRLPPEEKKNGARGRRVPRLAEFMRSERQADSQAELTLIEPRAIDFHKTPAGKIAIGVVEVW